jgi:hypothetical protein
MKRLASLALLLWCTPILAADHLQETTKLLLKSNPTSGRQKFVWLTRSPAPPVPSENPGEVGATVEIRNPITGRANGFTMPLGANWKVKDGTVYKFKNRDAPGGPSEIKIVVLKGGASLKIAGRSVGSELNDPPTREIAVVFTIGAGSDRYCGGCVLAQKDTTDAFVAKQCPAPSACGASSPSGAYL